jgi:hypothetical protein
MAEVPAAELERRRAGFTAPAASGEKGWLSSYERTVGRLPEGATLHGNRGLAGTTGPFWMMILRWSCARYFANVSLRFTFAVCSCTVQANRLVCFVPISGSCFYRHLRRRS